MDKIKTINDGKGKPQSWEASIDVTDGWPEACFSLRATGYGATEEEAIYSLKNALMNLTGLITNL